MKVYFNNVSGIADAIVSMYMSKRTWTPELNKDIYESCYKVFDRNGRFYNTDIFSDEDIKTYEKVQGWVNTLFKWGKKHITLLRFVDFSCVVEGLHRGAQDDFDSHAKRLDNRIIRSSTRLSDFGVEKSEYYEDKILTTDEVCTMMNINTPDTVTINGGTYVKTVNGYIKEEYKNDRDVKRGLYMLSIPSTFIFKCNITEWSHIVKERDCNSAAAPELKIMVEEVCHELKNIFPILTKEYFYDIIN